MDGEIVYYGPDGCRVEIRKWPPHGSKEILIYSARRGPNGEAVLSLEALKFLVALYMGAK